MHVIMVAIRSLGKSIGKAKATGCGDGTIVTMPILTRVDHERLRATLLRIRHTGTVGGMGVDKGPVEGGVGTGGGEVGKDTTAPTRVISVRLRQLRVSTNRTRVRLPAAGEALTRSTVQVCRRHPHPHLPGHHNHQVMQARR